MEAEFTEYPKVDNPTVSIGYTEADISFNNPCWYPSTFSKTAQTDPDDHRYTNDDVVFTLNPFTIEPERCQVIYECTEVVRVDGTPSEIGCANFVFDGTYDNQATDGKLTFSADQDDYLTQKYPPGEYTVTITGTVDKSVDQLTDVVTFTLTLVDPCDPPNQVTPSTLVN